MSLKLNKNQKEAVKHDGSPLLIIAGAGTGKTAVITQRIIDIVQSGRAKPSEILALTFTEKAASEMLERVDMQMPIGYDEVQISTFHSFADTVLRQDGEYIGLDTDYSLMTQAQSYILFRQNLFSLPMDIFRPVGNPTKSIGAVLQHFSRLQDEDVSPDKYKEFADAYVPGDDAEADLKDQYLELAAIYEAYTNLKFENSMLDFGDLIITLIRLFRERPSVLDRYASRYKYVLVDEFQDTNYTQNVMVNLLALGKDPEHATDAEKAAANLTVVGDDDQSIYKFRGAAISNILQFKQVFPQSRSIVLNQNYRSRQEILDAAYHLIQYNNPHRLEVTEQIDKRLKAAADFIEPEGDVIQRLHGHNSAEEADLISKEILGLVGELDRLKQDSAIVDGKFDDTGQGMFVDVRKNTKKPYEFKDIAILARSNSHLDEIKQALIYYGVPYKYGGTKGLYDQSEVKSLVSYLKVLADFEDDIHMFNLLQMDIWGLTPREIVDLMQLSKRNRISILAQMEELWGAKVSEIDYEEFEPSNILKKTLSAESISSLSNLMQLISVSLNLIKSGSTVGEVLYAFFKESGYLSSLTEREPEKNHHKVQNISKYFELIKEFENSNPDATIVQYVDYLDYSIEVGENPRAEEQYMEDLDAVSLLTIHSSKGLEYPVVFLVSMVAQRFPSKNYSDKIPIPDDLVGEVLTHESDKEEHLSEERRLAYVAITRAKEALYVTSADYYGGGKQKKKPSAFLSEMFDGGEIAVPGKIRDISKSTPSFEVKVSSISDDLEIKDLGLNNVSKISYSHVDMYEKCPKQYMYRYILRLPTEPSPALAFGSTVHNTLLEYYKRYNQPDLQGDALDVETLISIYEDKWIRRGYENLKHETLRKEYGEARLREFHAEMMGKGEDPIELEKKFVYKLDTFSLSGTIDRIDLVEELDDGTKVVDILDYKTGKVKEDRDVAKNLQLALYTHIAQELFGYKVRNASLIFVEHNEIKSANIEGELIEEALTKVRETVRGIREGHFDPEPGFFCSYCDFRDVCPDAAPL